MSRKIKLQRCYAKDVSAGDRVRIERSEPTADVVGVSPATWNGAEGVLLRIHHWRLNKTKQYPELWEVFLSHEDAVWRAIDV